MDFMQGLAVVLQYYPDALYLSFISWLKTFNTVMCGSLVEQSTLSSLDMAQRALYTYCMYYYKQLENKPSTRSWFNKALAHDAPLTSKLAVLRVMKTVLSEERTCS